MANQKDITMDLYGSDVPGTMLVVDDDSMYRTLLSISLEEKGYVVAEAEDGKQGWEMILAGDYDLVFLDLLMPEMNGFEVLERIKTDETTAHIPVIVVSGEEDMDSIVRCIESGAADYLNKPFDPVILHARVNASLATKRLYDQEKAYYETIRTQKEIAEAANRKIMESLNYAGRIQRSLLADPEELKTWLPDSFFIWEPRDVVGGDIYYTEFFPDGFILSVIDCTGHGVPGAFMTMIAISAMRRIIKDEMRRNPAGILSRLNHIVKMTLQQDKEYTTSDDGMDVGIVRMDKSDGRRELIFAGAKIPLYYTKENELHIVKGDRRSIGYKRSNVDFCFNNNTIPVEAGMNFYMATDGLTDQLGDRDSRKFGSICLKKLLPEFGDQPFEKQKKLLCDSFKAFEGENDRLDDVTMIGFRPPLPPERS